MLLCDTGVVDEVDIGVETPSEEDPATNSEVDAVELAGGVVTTGVGKEGTDPGGNGDSRPVEAVADEVATTGGGLYESVGDTGRPDGADTQTVSVMVIVVADTQAPWSAEEVSKFSQEAGSDVTYLERRGRRGGRNP